MVNSFYGLRRFVHPYIRCSAKSDVKLDSGVVHARLTEASMSGFCIVTDQKIKFDGMFDGVFIMESDIEPIQFKACCVRVEKLRDIHPEGEYKSSFVFLRLDKKYNKSLSLFINSSIKGYLTVV